MTVQIPKNEAGGYVNN